MTTARKRLGMRTECRLGIRSGPFRLRPDPEWVAKSTLGILRQKGRSLKGLHSRRTPHDSKGLMGRVEGNRALYSQPGASRTRPRYRQEQGYGDEATSPRYGRLGNGIGLQSNCFRKIVAMGCVFP